VPASIGHNGGSVTLQYSQRDELVIVVALSESFWTADLDQQAVYRLLASIRTGVT
jgi:hypothetical protein